MSAVFYRKCLKCYQAGRSWIQKAVSQTGCEEFCLYPGLRFARARGSFSTVYPGTPAHCAAPSGEAIKMISAGTSPSTTRPTANFVPSLISTPVAAALLMAVLMSGMSLACEASIEPSCHSDESFGIPLAVSVHLQPQLASAFCRRHFRW